MNRNKVLYSEYAAFRKKGVLEFFEKKLQSKRSLTIYDPMAGTAPLIPLVECGGHRAYFNDIFPLHYFINRAKTFNSFQCFRQTGKSWFLDRMKSHMKLINNKRLVISEKWIEKSVLKGLVDAWNSFEIYDEDKKVLLKAILLLCVKPLSSITETKNPTWIKSGGISTDRKLDDVIERSVARLENYYKYNYSKVIETKRGNCIFLNRNANDVRLPEKVDLIITSPPYCNRFAIKASYGPEGYFLSAAGFEIQDRDIIGTIVVKDYDSFNNDIDFLMDNSREASIVFSKMKESRKRDEHVYYIKYFCRYFINLYTIMLSVLENLKSNGKMYLVTQDNTHRGQSIEIEKILLELLGNKNWKSNIVNKWERHHMGLQNISRDSALVKPMQYEKLIEVWR